MQRFNFGRVAKQSNINICREDVTISKDGEETTIEDAFIVVFTKENFLDKKNINPLFEHIRGNTYRAVLDPHAGLATITAFGNAIKELDCARMVDIEYKRLVTHSSRTSVENFLSLEVDKESFAGERPVSFEKSLLGKYHLKVNVNQGLLELTAFGNAINTLKNPDLAFEELNKHFETEKYNPPAHRIMT